MPKNHSDLDGLGEGIGRRFSQDLGSPKKVPGLDDRRGSLPPPTAAQVTRPLHSSLDQTTAPVGFCDQTTTCLQPTDTGFVGPRNRTSYPVGALTRALVGLRLLARSRAAARSRLVVAPLFQRSDHGLVDHVLLSNDVHVHPGPQLVAGSWPLTAKVLGSERFILSTHLFDLIPTRLAVPRPGVDLFADADTALLPTFVSPGVDAF